MNYRWRFISVVFLATITLVASTALAQVDRAGVNGTVTDASGAVLPETDVVATSVDTGKQAEVRTNAVGIYVFPSLPVGTYTFTYSHGDFQSVEFQGGELRVGQTITLNAQMKVAAQTTSVEVKDVAPLLDRNSAEMAGVVGTSSVEDLPVNGRNWANLLVLGTGRIDYGGGTSEPCTAGS